MSSNLEITVENKLMAEKRHVCVYRHLTHKGRMISHGNEDRFQVESQQKGDYLHISVSSGPGDLVFGCNVDLPSWLDFQLTAEGEVLQMHNGDRTLLRIPPGPPTWQLKIKQPGNTGKKKDHRQDYVSVYDNKPGGKV